MSGTQTRSVLKPAAESARRLLIFTRVPRPGRCKTRLIPWLGEQGAAELAAWMLRHTLRHCALCGPHQSWSAELHVAGSEDDTAPSAAINPRGIPVVPQSAGDLGDRLTHAFARAFDSGAAQVVAVGSDCPALTAAHLQAAYTQLAAADVVIAPATDGGYALIGLRSPRPELFAGIEWGGPRVFAQTMAAARSAGLTVQTLAPLTDIDRPEDLLLLPKDARGRFLPDTQPGRISVIVPTRNEEANLAETLQAVMQDADDVEVIVVDGGSTDRTAEIAALHGARVCTHAVPRGCRLNAGTAIASGELLLFLHADTRLPAGWTKQVRELLSLPVAGGAFRLRIDARGGLYRLIEAGANFRSRRLGLPYGDQALFVRADLFRRLGGFPAWPIMEDVGFVRRLRRRGSIVICGDQVVTSARRWQRLGTVGTTLFNQFMLAAWILGASPDRLARWYR